jgi:inosine triphosphate pyrophosphatase
VINFVTGNQKKFEEASAILQKELPDITFNRVEFDLPEIQGEPEEIVRFKLQHALELQKSDSPLVIEDTSLCFNSLKGLPGPYIKHFLTKLGTSGLFKLVENFEDHSAYSQCIFGLAKTRSEQPKLFVGRTDGKIVAPRGDNKFGWDPVFQPDGFSETFAEMDSKVKNSISHRYRSLKQLSEFLKSNPEYLD